MKNVSVLHVAEYSLLHHSNNQHKIRCLLQYRYHLIDQVHKCHCLYTFTETSIPGNELNLSAGHPYLCLLEEVTSVPYMHPAAVREYQAGSLVCKQLLFCFCLSKKTGWFQQAVSNSVYVLCNVLCKCTPLNLNLRSVWKNASILIVSGETALWYG